MAKVPFTNFNQCREGMELESKHDANNHIFITNIRYATPTEVWVDWVRKGHKVGEHLHSGKGYRLQMIQWYTLMPETHKEFTDEEYESLLI